MRAANVDNTMNSFLDDNFLLRSESARRLFFDYAAAMPILDFHNHLPPKQVAEDNRFSNITAIWLGGDHYKWRAMRANGVAEDEITGTAGDEAKFAAWARTVPKTIGNPLYHWTHLELRRYFGIDQLLNESTEKTIWTATNSSLARNEFSVRGLLRGMKVRAICTTDDPCDDLEHHRAYARKKTDKDPIMVPTFRPDKAISVESPSSWNSYLDRLEQSSGTSIRHLSDLVSALEKRHKAFHEIGCRLSDHALEYPSAIVLSDTVLESAFDRLRKGREIESTEVQGLKTFLLCEIGGMNVRSSWTMQLHIGAIRNINRKMYELRGPDMGYDAIGDAPFARGLAGLLDHLNNEDSLGKTIIYGLNPMWNDIIGTIMGSFQDGGVPGKLQLGSAWWFNDQIDGMTSQLKSLANMGLLSRFVGMLTDSRSFLSFPRHEYFRRLLCNILGSWIEQGEAPADFELLGGMVKDICYGNAQRSLAIPGVEPVL